MRLNTLKTKSILIHSGRKVTGSTLELSVGGNQVEQVHSFKFLGVTINYTHSWSDHINMVCAKVSCNINLLRHLSWFRPQPLLLLFLKSYILYLFDYCDVVRSGAPSPRLLGWRPSTTTHAALSSINVKGPSHRLLVGTRFFHFGFQENLHLAVTMFNCMSSKSPPYLSQHISLSSSHYNTRSASSSQLNLPPNRSSFGQKSFSFMGTELWQSLPQNIRDTRDFTRYYSLCQ